MPKHKQIRMCEKDNCVVCILSPPLRFKCCAATSYLKEKCEYGINGYEHTLNKDYFYLIPLVINILILVPSIVNIFYLLLNVNDKQELLKLISELLYTTVSLIILLSTHCVAKYKLIAINGWVELSVISKKLRLKKVIPKAKIRELRRVSYMFTAILLLLFLMVLNSFTIDDTLSLNNFRRLSSAIAISIHIILSMQNCTHALFAHGMLLNCSWYVKHHLNNRKNLRVFDDMNLATKLKLARKFYVMIVQNFLYIMKKVGSLFVIWMSHAIFLLIINIYLLIVQYKMSTTFATILIRFQVVVFVFTLVITMKIIQSCSNVVSCN